MFDWLSILLSPVIGAGAGSLFGKFVGKKSPDEAESPAESLSSVNRRLAKINQWQIQTEEAIKLQDRQLRRLEKALAATRLFVLISILVAVIAAAACVVVLNKIP